MKSYPEYKGGKCVNRRRKPLFYSVEAGRLNQHCFIMAIELVHQKEQWFEYTMGYFLQIYGQEKCYGEFISEAVELPRHK